VLTPSSAASSRCVSSFSSETSPVALINGISSSTFLLFATGKKLRGASGAMLYKIKKSAVFRRFH
jgi:hypothetical protein